MSNSATLVSVIINCFNGEKYLNEAINSVIAQSYTEWEIIFWDNQSNDRSAQIFKAYKDKRLKYFYAEQHELLYKARNEAIKKAKGELIAFLDVDDFWESNKLAMQVSQFSNPKVGYSCGNFWIQNQTNGSIRVAFKRSIPSGLVLRDLLASYSVGMLTLVVRKKIIDDLDQVFDPTFNIIGDFDFVIKIARMGWKLAAVQKPIATYRIHSKSLTRQADKLHELELTRWTVEKQKEGVHAWKKNYKYLGNSLNYVKAINYLILGKKIKALKVALEMPMGVYKLRVIVMFFLPKFIYEHIKG